MECKRGLNDERLVTCAPPKPPDGHTTPVSSLAAGTAEAEQNSPLSPGRCPGERSVQLVLGRADGFWKADRMSEDALAELCTEAS
jgi:hypothetical protein